MSVKQEGEREILGLSEKEIERDGARDRQTLISQQILDYQLLFRVAHTYRHTYLRAVSLISESL